MKITAEPRSDQLNADDLVGSPVTVTVAGVKEGSAEQKYDIKLEGEKRYWRPPLTVLRILIAAWGDESKDWVGKQATLYRDKSVTFGKDQVGGIRVSHVSGIDRPLTLAVTVSRGRRKPVTVQPLKEPQPASQVPQQPTPEQIAACTDEEQLRAWWQAGTEAVKNAVADRKHELDDANA